MEEKQSGFAQARKRAPHSTRFFEALTVMRGDREVVVYGCKKILLYTPQEIRLAIKKQCLCVCGADLFCTSISGGAVTVEGRIAAIRYLETVAEGRTK